jgi:hypothetical protein
LPGPRAYAALTIAGAVSPVDAIVAAAAAAFTVASDRRSCEQHRQTKERSNESHVTFLSEPRGTALKGF